MKLVGVTSACCRPCFILGMHPQPNSQQQHMLQTYWLGNHSLKLPDQIPFLLEVAGNPEADGGLLVPSCCVLSPMGFSEVPPAAGDYMDAAAIMQQLLQQVCSSKLQLWGPGQLKVLGAKEAANGESEVACQCCSIHCNPFS
jgi:hypothetical protein